MFSDSFSLSISHPIPPFCEHIFHAHKSCMHNDETHSLNCMSRTKAENVNFVAQTTMCWTHLRYCFTINMSFCHLLLCSQKTRHLVLLIISMTLCTSKEAFTCEKFFSLLTLRIVKIHCKFRSFFIHLIESIVEINPNIVEQLTQRIQAEIDLTSIHDAFVLDWLSNRKNESGTEHVLRSHCKGKCDFNSLRLGLVNP